MENTRPIVTASFKTGLLFKSTLFGRFLLGQVFILFYFVADELAGNVTQWKNTVLEALGLIPRAAKEKQKMNS